MTCAHLYNPCCLLALQAFTSSHLPASSSSHSACSSPSRYLRLRMSTGMEPPKVLCYGEALVDRLGPLGGDPATDLPVVRFRQRPPLPFVQPNFGPTYQP